ncbi:MAG: class I SAM-dependent methyltransferase [Gemmatimonadaceae bacterium]
MSPLLTEEPPTTEIPALSAPRPPAREYAPFGNMESRNGLQERLEIPLMLRALRLPTGGRVLEVGCGRGVALPLLARRLAPYELFALDIDPVLLQFAERRVKRAGVRATLYEADVRALPFDSGSIDLVIDFGTCYHVSGGAQGARTALAEIARVLRPNGSFVHETPVAQHLAHPVRSFAKSLPWYSAPSLAFDRTAVLWAVRRKRAHWER